MQSMLTVDPGGIVADHCLNCGRSEQGVPLITTTFQDNALRICPECFPLLIHEPQNLLDKIPGFVSPSSLRSHEH